MRLIPNERTLNSCLIHFLRFAPIQKGCGRSIDEGGGTRI